MNWVLILVISVLAGYALAGYTKGFLKIVYSLISWVLMLVFVLGATPYIESYIKNETEIYQKMVVYCEEKICEQIAEQREGVDVSGVISFTDNEMLAALAERLPEDVIENFFESAENAAGEFLENNDIYGKAAVGMAALMVQGISVILALILGAIASAILLKLIGIISHLPLIGFADSILGLAAGAVNGLIVVWVCFYLVAVLSATEFCSMVASYIYANEFLTWLYEKNILLTLLI